MTVTLAGQKVAATADAGGGAQEVRTNLPPRTGPICGRRAEMQAIVDAFNSAQQQKRAGLVEITGPLGAEFHYGLPRALHGRVARMCAPDYVATTREQWALAFPPTGDDAHDEMIWHCYFNPSGVSGLGVVNTPAWRASVIPSTSGHGTDAGCTLS